MTAFCALAALMRQVVTDGRRLQKGAARRAQEFAQMQAEEAVRLRRLAEAIEFPP